MAPRKQVFLDVETGVELVMPVYAPTGHGWDHEINVETVHLDQTGDLVISTTKKLCAQPLEFLLPAQRYPFCVPNAETNPWHYIEQLERRCDSKAVQRYIVTGTPINAQVIIQAVTYSEPDGTGDISCTVRIQEYRVPEVIQTEASDSQVGAAREAAAAPEVSQYTVVKGDSLWSIARRFYGDGSLCYRLAAANNIANANLILPGQVLTLPPLDGLPAVGTQPKSVRVAAAIQVTTDETAAAPTFTADADLMAQTKTAFEQVIKTVQQSAAKSVKRAIQDFKDEKVIR